jgi:hypothetical protein
MPRSVTASADFRVLLYTKTLSDAPHSLSSSIEDIDKNPFVKSRTFNEIKLLLIGKVSLISP